MTSHAGTRQLVFAGLAIQAIAAAAILFAHSGVSTDLNPGKLAAGAGLFAGVGLYAALCARIPRTGRFRANVLRRFAVLSAAFVVIGTSEEIIWRGLAFDAMLPHGAVPALLLTTAGFAAMHAFGQSAAGVRTHVVTGFVFGSLRLLTGSLTASIVAHIIYNELVVLQRLHDLPERRLVEC